MSLAPPPVLSPTGFRTGTGMTVMAVLGLLLLRTALGEPIVLQALMVACGLGALALAVAIWRGQGCSLHWTDAGLVDASGRVIAARDAIVRVDRNPLSLKPSNGFTLHLSTPQDRAWQPGLYWRLGRRVGVGGLTSPGVAKALADRIALETAPPVA